MTAIKHRGLTASPLLPAPLGSSNPACRDRGSLPTSHGTPSPLLAPRGSRPPLCLAGSSPCGSSATETSPPVPATLPQQPLEHHCCWLCHPACLGCPPGLRLVRGCAQARTCLSCHPGLDQQRAPCTQHGSPRLSAPRDARGASRGHWVAGGGGGCLEEPGAAAAARAGGRGSHSPQPPRRGQEAGHAQPARPGGEQVSQETSPFCKMFNQNK